MSSNTPVFRDGHVKIGARATVVQTGDWLDGKRTDCKIIQTIDVGGRDTRVVSSPEVLNAL